MIKTPFKINIFIIIIFLLKIILKFFFYYYKIKSLNFLLIFFLPYFNDFLNTTLGEKIIWNVTNLLIKNFFNDLN